MNKTFKEILANNSSILLIYGGIKVGKFYFACKKAVIKCNKNKKHFLILTDDAKYAIELIESITNKNLIKYCISDKSFHFKNGSSISVLNYSYFIDNHKYLLYTDSIIKSAELLCEDCLVDVMRITTGQIIVTCIPYSTHHWTFKIENKIKIDRIF